MNALGYYNGSFGPLDEMTVPMTDRAVYYGDGVYEATPTRNFKIYAIDAHVDRMFRSASMLRIEMPLSKEELKSKLKSMMTHMDQGDNVLYWQVSRGTARRAHPFPEGKANLMMMITPYKFPDLKTNVSLMTEEDTRFLHCNIKTLNLIPSIMAMQKAKENGCYEAILHRGERVTECSKSNVSILKNGTLITAPTDNLILAGIARSHILEACKALGIPFEERPYTVSELMDADEVFTSSSTSFIRRAEKVDGEAHFMKDEATFDKIRTYVWDRFVKETND